MVRRALSRGFRRAQNYFGFILFPQKSFPNWEGPERSLSLNKIVLAPLDHMITLKGLKVSSNHPWVRALGSTGPPTQESEIQACAELLAQYYAEAQPASLPEYLGTKKAPSWLYHIPPNLDFFPWDNLSASLAKRFQCSSECTPEGTHGVVDANWPGFGPQRQIVIEKNSQRLVGLFNSINRVGFRSTDAADGLPTAQLLIFNNEKWRWLIGSGSHRVAAAKAAGLDEVPVRVTSIVRKSMVSSWPGVQNSLFSVQEATELFDAYFR